MGVIASRSCNNGKDDDTISSLPRTNTKNLTVNTENNIPGLHLSEIQHLKQITGGDHVRQGSIRSRLNHPMPDPSEVDKRFAKVLASMDLPPDKAKLLKNYDDEKKWSIICDQEMVTAKDPPLHYLTKLRTYLDPKASRSHRKRKIVGESTSTQVLRDLEISLRTNHIEWVKEFLDSDNQGLDALVDYLSFRLLMMRHEQKLKEENKLLNENNLNNSSELNSDIGGHTSSVNNRLGGGGGGGGSGATSGLPSDNHNYNSNTSIMQTQRPRLNDLIDSPSLKRRSRHIVKLNMGTSTDDIHVCIMCLRAIMNNKYGFNMVIQHREAINNIALSIIHKSLRTKALVLELLAAICLVKGGHEIILAAFDNFKEVYQESKRFSTLMTYFMNYEIFNIDFMVACMQFVNIVVHSVEDMNYRVHLQYEFTSLGLDDYLEKLKLTESEELHIQISAYLDNVFDVASLMEDSETKTSALERVQELEDNLGRALDRQTEIEREYLYKLTEIDTEMQNLKLERDSLIQLKDSYENEIKLLKNVLQENQQELNNTKNQINNFSNSDSNQNKLLNSSISNNNNNNSISVNNNKVPHENTTIPAAPIPPPPSMMMLNNFNNSISSTSSSTLSPPSQMNNTSDSCSINNLEVNRNSSTKPNQPPAPPPIIPLPPSFTSPMAPPMAGLMPAPDGAMTIKRKVQTKYKLPTLNWVALKPNQVRGTIFNELDDEKIYVQIDFLDFEEKFKIGFGGGLVNGSADGCDGLKSFPSKRIKVPENISLLDHNRLRNTAIFLKKLNTSIDTVVKSINNLDLKSLSLDKAEILQKLVPTDEEIKAYRKYVIDKKDLNQLTDEDKFMYQLTKVERISTKLYIMHYMGNYYENLNCINPQIYAIKNASNSLKSSYKFKQLLEIILAFGNYLNSSKRGPAYGFKLQSLDNLLDTKSTDKKTCLLHYITSTVRHKFPELLNFDTELYCIEEASQFLLENITTDLAELEKGMKAVKQEVEVGSKGVQIHMLKEFLHNSEDKLKKTQRDANLAMSAFKECVEYFGETSRNTDANTFFALIVRFTKAFKASDQENEQRRRLAQAAALAMDKKENGDLKQNRLSKKQQQEAVINELKSKTTAVREKKLLHQDEVYNGALEDILLGLKSEPYRRADAVRRSHRRRIDSNRLSKNLEELQL